MRELAQAIRAKLAGSGITIREETTNFEVHVSRHDRSCEARCFWYEDVAGRDGGSDADVVRFGQVSTGLPRTPKPRGAEYLLVLRIGETRVAEGRAHSSAEVIGCVRAWVLDRSQIEELYEPFPFVDRTRRLLARVAAKIEAGLRSALPVRVVVEEEWSRYSLWTYGDGRSCTIEVDDARSACAFLILQSQAAHLIAPEYEIVGAVAAWTTGVVRSLLSRGGGAVQRRRAAAPSRQSPAARTSLSSAPFSAWMYRATGLR